MNKDLDLPSLADFQSCFDQSWDLIQVADAGLRKHSFASDLSDLVHHALSSGFAPIRNIINDHIGATFGEKDAYCGSDTSALIVSI